MSNQITKFMNFLYLGCVWVAGISILMMSLIIPFGVFTRYVLGTGSSWPEPVAIVLMITFTFFGAASSYRNSSHIAVEMITNRLPPKLKSVFSHLSEIMMFVIAIFLVFYGFNLASEMMRQSVAQLPWLKVGITYLPIPIASLITALFILEKFFIGAPHLEEEPDIDEGTVNFGEEKK